MIHCEQEHETGLFNEAFSHITSLASGGCSATDIWKPVKHYHEILLINDLSNACITDRNLSIERLPDFIVFI